MANYIIDTMVDATTGKTTVSVTTYGAQGQVYQDKWVSGLPAGVPTAATGVTVSSVSANLSALDVLDEAAVAGAQLSANVAAGLQAVGVLSEPNPDPSEL